MKKLAIVILLLSPVLSFAQMGLINRVDVQTGDSHPLLLQGSTKTFSTSFHDTTIRIMAGSKFELQGSLTNLTIRPVKIIFERTHLKVDTNVSAGICDLCNCYPNSKDSLSVNNPCAVPPGLDTQKFSYSPVTVNMTQADTLIDYIKLTSLSGDPGDTASFTVKTFFSPQSVVEQKQPLTIAGPSITAIYPSPLIQGSSIKVRISSPRDCSLSYSIFDGIGRTVGFGATRQHLNLGDNTIEINSLDGFSNGVYTLKLNFGDGSSDSHFFQVLR